MAEAKGLSFKQRSEGIDNPRILALDIGTTTLRAHIYDKNVCLCSSAERKVNVIFLHYSVNDVLIT